jgi:exopolysaccharide production protein ExoQ
MVTSVSRQVARRSFARSAKPSINYEFVLLTAALLLTAVIPGLSKYQAEGPPTNSLANEITWSLIYVLAAVRLYAMRAKALPLFRRSIALWTFVFLMLVSVLWSVDPSVTFTNAIELIGTTIIGYYIVTRFSLPEFMGMLGVTFVVIAALSFFLIFAAPGHGRMDWGTGAWDGIYQDKNNLGAAASLAIISQLILLGHCRGRTRMLVLGGLLLLGALLIGANSATAFADALAVLVILLVVRTWRSPRYGGIARVATIGGVVLAAMTVLAFGLTPDTAFSLLGRAPNLTGRTDFWPYLEHAIADQPWLGYGYNAFFRSSVFSDYMSDYLVQSGGWTPYHAHNSFLQILLDGGFIGLAAFLWLLAVAIWRGIVYIARESSRVAPWPLAIVLYLLFGSFTETYFANCNTVEWILFISALLYPLRELRTTGTIERRAPSTLVGPIRDFDRQRKLGGYTRYVPFHTPR